MNIVTTEEIKELILSAKSIERESERVKQEIEQRREEMLSIHSTLNGSVHVMNSAQFSMPERVCFALEKLYDQYSDVLQRLSEKRREVEAEIATLDPIEQEIVRAWIDGKTEEQIGKKVGYSDRTVRRQKRRILVKLAKIKSCPPMS